jgi:hypothetical protein
MTTTTGRILTATATGAFQTSANAPYIEGTSYDLYTNGNNLIAAAGQLRTTGGLYGPVLGANNITTTGVVTGGTMVCTTSIDPTAIIDNSGTSKGTAYQVLTASSSGSSLSWQLPTFPYTTFTVGSSASTTPQTVYANGSFPASTTANSYRLNFRVTSWPNATLNQNVVLYMTYDTADQWTSYMSSWIGGLSFGYSNDTRGAVFMIHNNLQATYPVIFPFDVDICVSNPYRVQRKNIRTISSMGVWSQSATYSAPYQVVGTSQTTTARTALYIYSEASCPAMTISVYPWS